jgi:hypothetical protein
METENCLIHIPLYPSRVRNKTTPLPTHADLQMVQNLTNSAKAQFYSPPQPLRLGALDLVSTNFLVAAAGRIAEVGTMLVCFLAEGKAAVLAKVVRNQALVVRQEIQLQEE